ncbi:MAG: hypothetical protein QOF97_1191, partial [Acidimicrobiaceae bacterium]
MRAFESPRGRHEAHSPLGGVVAEVIRHHEQMLGRVTHLHRSDVHDFSKSAVDEVLLVAGLGV